MSTVLHICDTIGRRRLAEELGVRTTAVSNAVVDGLFPARWFRIVRRLCAEAEIECPESLFSFLEPDTDSDNTGAAA